MQTPFLRLAVGVCATLMWLGSNNAFAAPIAYDFSGTLDSGAYVGESFSGTFSFDDFGLIGSGDEYLAVDGVDLVFHGQYYGLADALVPPEVAYLDGAFLGLSYDVDPGTGGISLIPGFLDVADAYLAYDPGTPVGAGFGTVAYVQAPATVPEPDTLALLLTGAGFMGYMVRRRT